MGQRTVDASVIADEVACPALSSPVQIVNPTVQVGLINNMKISSSLLFIIDVNQSFVLIIYVNYIFVLSIF